METTSFRIYKHIYTRYKEAFYNIYSHIHTGYTKHLYRIYTHIYTGYTNSWLKEINRQDTLKHFYRKDGHIFEYLQTNLWSTLWTYLYRLYSHILKENNYIVTLNGPWLLGNYTIFCACPQLTTSMTDCLKIFLIIKGDKEKIYYFNFGTKLGDIFEM